MAQEYHVPVMLGPCIEGLAIKEDGLYADLTFGGGGHSREILKYLTSGRLFGFDQDPDARAEAEKIETRSFTFIEANFRYFKRYLKAEGVAALDGILADLGVSSHQIDNEERGFSTRFDANLDMRMGQEGEKTAAFVVNTYSEEALHRILGMYGEVRNAKTLAQAIAAARNRQPINRNSDLIALLKPFARKGKEFRYYAQVFQALRIEVNDELKALEEMLQASASVLKPGGRLVVLSYHSLEDRLVKNFINKGNFKGKVEQDFYGNVIKPLEAVNRKPKTASDEEIKINNRARSAKLRIAQKI